MSGGPISAAELKKIDHKKGETLADFVPRLGSTTLDFMPGSRWSYSPTAGFDTLGRETVFRCEALKRTVTWDRARPPTYLDLSQFDYSAEDASLNRLI